MFSPKSLHAIMDPIHGPMIFSKDEKELMKPIIDTALFQRLRHIKQLGLADLIFPGAVHTRFNHSLGVCFLASKICQRLLDTNESSALNSYRQQFLASLLHDIGHGPFSHAFEKFLKNTKDKIKHEDWTYKFLEQIAISSRQAISLEEIDTINKIISGHSQTQSPLNSIVSSQLDADRLDYLIRDSHFCGVEYGRYDLNWLIHCLAIENHEGSSKLVVDVKGERALDHYLIARRQMTHNIYYHKKIRAAESQLECLLGKLAALDDRYLKKMIPNDNFKNFLLAAREFRTDSISKSEMIERSFHYYSMLTEADIITSIHYCANSNDESTISGLAKDMINRNIPEAHYLDREKSETAKLFVNSTKEKYGLEDFQLNIIDAPFKSLKSDKDHIFIKNGDQIVRYGSNSLLQSLSDQDDGLQILLINRNVGEKIKNEIKDFLHSKHILHCSIWKKAA